MQIKKKPEPHITLFSPNEKTDPQPCKILCLALERDLDRLQCVFMLKRLEYE